MYQLAKFVRVAASAFRMMVPARDMVPDWVMVMVLAVSGTPVIVTILVPPLEAPKPFRVMLDAMLLATVLLLVLAMEGPDISSTPSIWMLLTVVLAVPLTAIMAVVAAAVLDRVILVNTSLPGLAFKAL